MRKSMNSKSTYLKKGVIHGLLHSNRLHALGDRDKKFSHLILRKFRTAITRPHTSFRVGWRRLGDVTAYHRLSRLGCTEFFGDQPIGTLQPEWCDLLHLYSVVRARQPRVVIEFGSGCSTAVIAKALLDNMAGAEAGAEFHSFEREERWFHISQSYLSGRERDIVHLHLLGNAKYDLGAVRDAVHPALPGVVPNLLYIDDADSDTRALPVADLPVLEALIPDDFFMIVDGRAGLVDFLRQTLKRRYRIVYNKVHYYTTFELVDSCSPRGPVATGNFGGGRFRTEVSYLNMD